MSRNHRIARSGLLTLMAGAALAAAASPAAAALLPGPGGHLPAPGGLLRPERLVKPEIYRPDGSKPCLHALPLCLPDRSQFASVPQHAS